MGWYEAGLELSPLPVFIRTTVEDFQAIGA